VICFKCLKELDHVFPVIPDEDGHEPDGGLIFSASGNYGSRVYDPTISAPQLVIWICDSCVIKHKELVAVRSYAFVQTQIQWADFDPDEAYW
jgi:hypothetical protein